MTAIVVSGFTLIGLVAGLLVALVVFDAGRRGRPGRCSGCTHPSGCGNAFGECTRKIRVRNYVSGTRRGWKYEPCRCRNHAAAVTA
jgi:hypothetical protein